MAWANSVNLFVVTEREYVETRVTDMNFTRSYRKRKLTRKEARGVSAGTSATWVDNAPDPTTTTTTTRTREHNGAGGYTCIEETDAAIGAWSQTGA